MTAPVVFGGMGIASHGLGRLGLGGPQPALNLGLPAMATQAQPYIAHLYDRNLVFKRLLGGVGVSASLLNKPGLKLTQNGGYQQIVLEVAAPARINNLAPNPSFEPTRDTSKWALYNNGPEAATIADVSDGTAFDGINLVRVGWIVPNTSQKGLQYNGAALFAPRQSYALSFVARGTGGAVGVAMQPFWNVLPLATVALSNPPLTTSWQRYVFRLDWGATTDAHLFISLAAACAAGTLDLDAMQVELGSTASTAGTMLGDVIRLGEQGDNAGTILFSGNVETTPDETAVGGTHHLITVTPWIAELGDAYFNQTYSAPTDVAQFVRDAIRGTAHCSVSPISCPDTGIKAIYDFQNTNALDAVHVAKQIAGPNYFYFVDAQGVVWFQPAYTSNPPTVTLRRGVDFNSKKPTSSIVGMRNLIPLVGGSNPGDPGRIKSTYGVGDPRGTQALYGVRAFNPTLAYPTVTDQPTLDAIAASLGAQYDRVLTTVAATLPALGKRLTPGRPGGLTVRFWEPAVEALEESGEGIVSGYSPTLILQDVEVLSPEQRIVVGDVPYSDIDPAYEAARILQRLGVVSATAVPVPALLPPDPTVTPPPTPPPAQINVSYNANAAPGIYAMGGGIVIIAQVTFTTPRAGVCQVLGALDARMESWDNYVAGGIRREAWVDLPTIITTVSPVELPFGITRAQYSFASVSGIAIPAGTYTVSMKIQTTGGNQMHVYSGWAGVLWTG